jgi:hypothetical protein
MKLIFEMLSMLILGMMEMLMDILSLYANEVDHGRCYQDTYERWSNAASDNLGARLAHDLPRFTSLGGGSST